MTFFYINFNSKLTQILFKSSTSQARRSVISRVMWMESIYGTLLIIMHFRFETLVNFTHF